MTLKFDAQQFDALERVAEKIFRSGVCPADVKNADAAFAIMLAGAEMGFEPMQSIRLISLVKGKVSLNADAQIAMCTRVRDVCEYFRLAESTAERATFVTHRKGHPAPVELTWTFEQAKAAGLTGSSTWRAHPGAMLRARCGAALARAVYPDLVAGVYDPDEAEEIRRDEPADHSRPRLAPPPAANDTDPLATYRTRVAAAAGVDELVAVALALVSFRDHAFVKSVIVITHDPDVAARAGRTVWIRDGLVVDPDRHLRSHLCRRSRRRRRQIYQSGDHQPLAGQDPV